MELNGGEIAILVILMFNLLVNAFFHGEDKNERYDIVVSVFRTFLAFLIFKWAGLF